MPIRQTLHITKYGEIDQVERNLSRTMTRRVGGIFMGRRIYCEHVRLCDRFDLLKTVMLLFLTQNIIMAHGVVRSRRWFAQSTATLDVIGYSHVMKLCILASQSSPLRFRF